jgi:hypothetical protein
VTSFRASRPLVAASAFALIAAAACGGSDGGTKGGDNSAPAAISISGGNSQTGMAGSALAAPLAARVTNAQGNPVSGKPVNFTVTRGLGTVASTTVNTDNNGIAQTAWTLGTGAVRQEVLATIGSYEALATANIDTTRALFLLALKDTVSVGDTIWINSISGTTGLGGEVRGAVQQLITSSIPAATKIAAIHYLSGEYFDYQAPTPASLSFVTSNPTNTIRRHLYLQLGYVAQAIGAGKDVQFTHTSASFLGARSFNDIRNRVSVVGTSVHIR